MAAVGEADEAVGRASAGPDRAWLLLAVGAVLVGVVLRFWAIGALTLSPDESYSAYAAHLPLTEGVSFIRDTDPHPPLSYVLLAGIERVASSEAALRLLGVVPSVGAVVLAAWWLRRRPVLAGATALFLAVSPYQLHFGRQARMYGLLVLAGVACAAGAGEWTAGARRRGLALVAAGGLVAALSHSVGFVVLAGLALVPGRRTDRDAWWFRGAVAGVGAAWLLWWWGFGAPRWSGTSLYDTLTVDQAARALNELVAAVPSNAVFVLPLLVAGGVLLARTDRAVAWVLLCVAVVPTAVLAVVSLRIGVFIPKSLAVVSWGAALALAGLVQAAWDRARIAGVAVVALVPFVLLLPYVPTVLTSGDPTAETVALLTAEVRPGDVVVHRPAAFPGLGMPEWYLALRDDRPWEPVTADRWPDAAGFVVGDAPRSGRVWVVEFAPLMDPVPLDGAPCAPDRRTDGTYLVRCVVPADPLG